MHTWLAPIPTPHTCTHVLNPPPTHAPPPLQAHLLVAKELEAEGSYKEAEKHYTEAKDWRAAVVMYRTQVRRGRRGGVGCRCGGVAGYGGGQWVKQQHRMGPWVKACRGLVGCRMQVQDAGPDVP